MSNTRNITLEEIEVTEGKTICSYDVEVKVDYDIEDCDCTSAYGEREVTQSWQEVNIEDIEILSYYKYKEDTDAYGNNSFYKSTEEMPKETIEFIKQKVIDDSSEYVLDH